MGALSLAVQNAWDMANEELQTGEGQLTDRGDCLLIMNSTSDFPIDYEIKRQLRTASQTLQSLVKKIVSGLVLNSYNIRLRSDSTSSLSPAAYIAQGVFTILGNDSYLHITDSVTVSNFIISLSQRSHWHCDCQGSRSLL